MKKGRIEAYSDAVIAIVITIMVLELKAPHAATFEAIFKLWPILLSYVLSFIYISIYWNNHHHLFMAVKTVTGPILWANTHLLFWLSIIPFTTAWMGENHFAPLPTALYGFVMLMTGAAYTLLVRLLVKHEGKSSMLSRAMGHDYKGKISVLIYFIGIPCAFVHVAISGAAYLIVALIWLVPDSRIEHVVDDLNRES